MLGAVVPQEAKLKVLKFSFVIALVAILTGYSSGEFLGGIVILILAAVLFCWGIVRRNGRRELLMSSVILTAAAGCIATISIISGHLAEKESAYYIVAANSYRRDFGSFPTSLRQLDSVRLAGRNHLRIGSSQVFMIDDVIAYTRFPGEYVFYNLNTKKTVVRRMFPSD